MILHIDMDAFYASVEQLDNPDLKGRCVIVGGDSRRGVVSAASYEARKFGVHSAMPIFQARERCPQGVFVRPRMQRYKELSRMVMAILGEFSPLVEQVSIDEAYMDVSGCERLHGSPSRIAAAVKKRVKFQTGLTCSVGVAPNRFLAKVASDMNKPDGLTVIAPQEVTGFIQSLPIGKVPGVGRMTRRQLEAMGIQTLGDVRTYSSGVIEKRLGKYGRRLLELAAGNDSVPVTPHSPHKSISSETTLAEDTCDRLHLKNLMLARAEEVARQLREHRLKARTVFIKIKHADFHQITRSRTLDTPSQSTRDIFAQGAALLEAAALSQAVRLVGIGVSNLVPADTPVQMQLFEEATDTNHGWRKVDQALDAITGKFGNRIIGRAAGKN